MLYCRFKIYVWVTACVLAFFAGMPMACAQNSAPEVEIDWDVLQALGQPASSAGNAAPQQPLSRPVQQSWKPSLTAPPPAPVQQQAAPPPPPPAAISAAPSAGRISRPVREPETPAAATPKALKAQAFPVQTTVRSESSNPALAPTKQTPVVAVKKDTSPITPLPDETDEAMKSAAASIPVPPRKPEALKKVASLKTPPLPKHRPDIQMASASFVAQARAQAAQQNAASQKAVQNQNKIIKQEGPRVAALPAGAVAAEPLKPVTIPLPPPVPGKMAVNDPLAKQIVSPSKNELVDAIDNISKNKFAFFSKKQKPARIEAKPLVKPEAIDITATPPETNEIAVNDITEKLAAIEPAASDASAEIPRPPPQEKYEEDYVSLKFAPGASEPDEKITAQIQNDILSQLQDNPGWRVQIQAFASPAGAGVSNARRISLSRALAIRSWLMDKGIEASRMDVRALGAESDRQPLDRVDLVLFDPKNG